ncbi:hypothetical protein H4Q26_004715 [Puccinia striiformis f. sp. tritici PST-130]|nr:hypothetical protein H4Q26_004715 [Puccinia striiformis f. sp. tritici PST-130]
MGSRSSATDWQEVLHSANHRFILTPLLGSPSDPTSQLTLDVALPEITLATSSNAPAAKAAIPPAVRVVKPKKTGSKKTRTKPKATGTRCAKAGAINICTYLEEERNHQQLYGSRQTHGMEKGKFGWEQEKHVNKRQAALEQLIDKELAAEKWLVEGRLVTEAAALMRAINGVSSQKPLF